MTFTAPNMKANHAETLILVDKGISDIETAEGKRLNLIIGRKKAGKSTTVNYLFGKRMRRRFENGKFVVECERKEDELARIGTELRGAETVYSKAYVDKSGLALCDCPGFFDNRGPEVELAGSISIEAAVRLSENIGNLLIVIPYEDLLGEGDFTELCVTLNQLFKKDPKFAPLCENNLKSALFLITKATDEIMREGIERTVIATVNAELVELTARERLRVTIPEKNAQKESSRRRILSMMKNENTFFLNPVDNGESRTTVLDVISRRQLQPGSEVSKDLFNFNGWNSGLVEFDTYLTDQSGEVSKMIADYLAMRNSTAENETRLIDLGQQVRAQTTADFREMLGQGRRDMNAIGAELRDIARRIDEIDIERDYLARPNLDRYKYDDVHEPRDGWWSTRFGWTSRTFEFSENSNDVTYDDVIENPCGNNFSDRLDDRRHGHYRTTYKSGYGEVGNASVEIQVARNRIPQNRHRLERIAIDRDVLVRREAALNQRRDQLRMNENEYKEVLSDNITDERRNELIKKYLAEKKSENEQKMKELVAIIPKQQKELVEQKKRFDKKFHERALRLRRVLSFMTRKSSDVKSKAIALKELETLSESLTKFERQISEMDPNRDGMGDLPFSHPSDFSSVRSIDLSRWYTDNDMRRLLDHYVGNARNVNILTSIDAMQSGGYTLAENLRQAQLVEKLQASFLGTYLFDTTIIPINLGNLHWVALYIRYGEDRTMPTIGYFDPFGDAMPVQVQKAISEVYPKATNVLNCPIKLQKDSNNCGPWVVAILESLVVKGGLPSECFDIEMRRNQDMQILHSDFFCGNAKNVSGNVKQSPSVQEKAPSEVKQPSLPQNQQRLLPEEIKIPDAFLCPISKLIMHDPVTNSAGQTYEREDIERWFNGHDTDPKTGIRLQSKTLYSNTILRGMIREFLESHQGLCSTDDVFIPEQLIAEVKLAIRNGDLTTLKLKVSSCRALLVREHDSLLALACQAGNPLAIAEVIRILGDNLKTLAEVTVDNGASLFQMAARANIDSALLIARALNWNSQDIEKQFWIGYKAEVKNDNLISACLVWEKEQNAPGSDTILLKIMRENSDGAQKIVAYLLNQHHAQINLNAKDSKVDSALHLAVKNDWLDIVSLLIKNGANLRVRNKDKRLPQELAVDLGNEALDEAFTQIEFEKRTERREMGQAQPIFGDGIRFSLLAQPNPVPQTEQKQSLLPSPKGPQ